MNDLRRTYGCRLRNSTNRRLVASSNMARLILMDGQQQQQPPVQVLHSLEQLIVIDQSDQLAATNAMDSGPMDFVTAVNQPPTYTRHGGGGQRQWSGRPRHSNRSVSSSPSSSTPHLLLLPCAVRQASPAADSRRGQWFFQPSASLSNRHLAIVSSSGASEAGDLDQVDESGRQVALEQLVQHNRRWLQLATLTGDTDQHLAGLNVSSLSPQASRLIVGPSFLAIERPRRQLTGRFIYQLADGGQESRTVCDISVIVRQPIKLRMRLATATTNSDWQLESSRELSPVSSARRQLSATDETKDIDDHRGNRWLSLGWLRNWFEGPPGETRSRLQRRSSSELASDEMEGGDLNARRVRVLGPGRVPQTPVVRLGERLELNCLVAGHPIDSISWFRQGQGVNVQSSTDFQTEISNHQASNSQNGSSSSAGLLISRLLIRQLQPRHLGLQMFECFAGNSLGDRARASLSVYVAERAQLERARSRCPLGSALAALADDEPNNLASWPADQDNDDEQHEPVGPLAGHLNPFKWALVLEGEPIELQCPSGPVQQPMGGGEFGRQHQTTDWFKWNGGRGTDLASWLIKWRSQQQRTSATSQMDTVANDPLMASSSGRWSSQPSATESPVLASRQLVASQFGQLFGGDSRFVMNGSSLQIRSPSKRHDETLFVCVMRQRHKPTAATGGGAAAAGQQPHSLHQSSSGQYRARAASDCLESLFMLAELNANSAGDGLQQLPGDHQERDLLAPLVSSISIRIVAKPKIDPFEFSRSLEEGMRTVVVCTVVSGQSLVDINWFKDGHLLVAEDKENSGMSIEFANGFSSSLTFHRIRPDHSGQYTCIASNTLAAAEHSSRLLVNVAPYFIEPPKSQRVYLNSNVLINCRADGQPSPQIRWRKLVPVGSSGLSIASETPKGVHSTNSLPTRLVESVAPAGGGGGPFDDYSSILAASQQMALVASGSQGAGNQLAAPQTPPTAQSAGVQAKQEFRIITSNSHIQILENGSMIIREVELADAARYSCQASNGVQPILSEAIDLQVLVPAQFDVTYETVSVKRDSLVKLNCVPRGDQPMQIRWFKEGVKLARQQPPLDQQDQLQQQQQQTSSQPLKDSKYTELLHVLAVDGAETTTTTGHNYHHHQLVRRPDGSQQSSSSELVTNRTTSRHHQLVLLDQRHQPQDQLTSVLNRSSGAQYSWLHEDFKSIKSDRLNFNKQTENAAEAGDEKAIGQGEEVGSRTSLVVGSELVINSVERSDSGLFVCLASNPYGRDELTYRLIVQEPPDAPFNLQLQSVLSTSLKLMWQAPFDGNSPINYFVIEYRKLAQGAGPIPLTATQSASSGPEWLRVVVNSNPMQQQQQLGQEQAALVAVGQSKQATTLNPTGQTNVVTLKQLAPKSAYQIRVAAVNSIGQGPFSPIQVISTAEEAPQTRPADFRAQPIGSAAIKLSWRGPVPRPQDESPIRGYYVSHRRSQLAPLAGAELEKAAPDSSNSLSPSAANSGWLATVSVSSSNYSAQSGDSNLLLLTVGNSNDQQPTSALKGQKQQLVAYEFLLQMLDRNTKYDIRVQPFNSMGLGPAAELTVATLSFDRPRQPVVKLVEARKQSLELKWSVPGFSPAGPEMASKTAAAASGSVEATNSINSRSEQEKSKAKPMDMELLGFSLYYKCEFDDWQEIQLALIFHYVIENLRCGNKYQIYLSAYNSVGRSDPSDVMSVRTEGTVPLAPDKSVFFKVNTTEVTLNMASWSSGGCPISSFMVQYKRLNDKNWFILSEAAEQRPDKIVVPDLVPATWYKLLVVAQNEAGTTNAEYIFGTLTRDGQPMTPPNYLMEQQQIQQPVRAFSSLLNSLIQFISGSGNGTTSQQLVPNSGQQADGQLLFPLSCVLLLLVTSLASYLYYSTTTSRSNKSSSFSTRHQGSAEAKSSSKCHHHHQHGSSSRPSEHTMQLFDGHLLRAGSHSCLNGLEGVADSTASSSGSSQAGGGLQGQRQHSMASKTLTLRHHNRHAQQLFQSMLLSDPAASKSQLLANDDQQQQLNHNGGAFMQHQLDQSSQQSLSHEHTSGPEHNQPQLDQATALTNYVLDSFLSGQQQAPASIGGNLPSGAVVRQLASMSGTCRAATMKLFTNHNHQHQAMGTSYFDGAASSSMSSSGLGYSANTQTSGGPHHDQELTFGHNLQQQHLQHQQQPASSPNGYDLDCDQMLDELQQQPGGHLTNHMNLIQSDDAQQQQYHFAPMQQIYAAEQQQPIQSGGLRLLSSSSFASAADLLQRQQSQNEPIYQRLDRFKGACGLSNCATLNPQLAYKMKQHLLNANQQQQQSPLDEPNQSLFMAQLGDEPSNSIEQPSLGALAAANEYQQSACDSMGHDDACLETANGDQEAKCNQNPYNINCK